MTGVLTLVAGNGTAGYSGDNGPATSAQLSYPAGVAVDAAGNLYIAGGNRIRKVSNGVITTVAGNGTAGYSGDNGPATSAQLSYPAGVAVDAAGNLYVAGDNRIRKVSNGVITTVAGNGTAGYSGDNGPATSAQLNWPISLAVDGAGNLYIVDNQNFCIRKVSNGLITTVAGNGTQGYSGDNVPATGARLDAPEGVAVDGAGNLYIADGGSDSIRKVSNGVITTVAGNGACCGFGGDNGPATSAELYAPNGVAVDGAGNLYIADSGNDRIRRVSNGVITTVAGGAGAFGDNGPATGADLWAPEGVAVDSSGNLYVADTFSQRIRRVSNGVITTVAGGGSASGPAGGGYSGDNGPAASAQLKRPSGVAVDGAGNLYIADNWNNCIRKVSNGVITTVVSGLRYPAGVAVDAAGNLYIADSGNNRVLKVSNGVVATVAGNGIYGYSGDNGPATSAQLYAPDGIAVDGAGNLYIADIGNYRIRKVSNGVITTVAGNGTYGYDGDNGPAAHAQLGTPSGVAVDAAGNLYIADYMSQRIRKVSNGVITTVAGNGTGGFSGDNGPAAHAQFYAPSGIAVDGAGNLYIADMGNDRIRVLTPSPYRRSLRVERHPTATPTTSR
jgi:sugar lactone lactonase YvrE